MFKGAARARGERFFRNISETLPFIVIVIDRDGKLIYANPACRRENLRVGETNISDIVGLIHADDLSRLQRSLDESRQTGQGFEHEIRALDLEGIYRWQHARVQPLRNDMWLVSCIDVDARRRGQEALRFLADSSLVLATCLDSDITLTRVARIAVAGFCDVCFVHLKNNRDEVKTLTRAFAKPDHEEAALMLESELFAPQSRFWNQTLKMGRSRLEISLPDRVQSSLGSFIAVPLFTRGEIVGALTFVNSVSAKKYDAQDLEVAEELARRASTSIENLRLFVKSEEANRAKSSFLANMSHEIRTPLAGVLGYAELMLQADQSEIDRRECIHAIQRNGQQLTRLVDDLLDLTKVEAGRLKVENLKFNLIHLILDVRSMLSLQARQKNLKIAFSNSCPIPELVLSDPMRLRQVLLNVIGNALKFSESGTIDVRLSIESSPDLPLDLDDRRERLCFEVQDPGLGMSLEQQQRLFEPFSQADNSTTRRYGGTGLGLVLSRKLTRLLGGELWLSRSELGRGSSFKFYVPLTPLRDPAMVDDLQLRLDQSFRPLPGQRASGSKRALDGLRILLVEDAPDNQFLISKILSLAGAKVDLASDGREGVAKALAHTCDLVLMDIQMPVMDGYEATKFLRKSGFQKPILALTAHALTEERTRTLAAGCNDHLTKPIDAALLVQKLVAWNARHTSSESINAEALTESPQPTPPLMT